MIQLTYNDLGDLVSHFHVSGILRFIFVPYENAGIFSIRFSTKPYVILEVVFVIDLNPFESVCNI